MPKPQATMVTCSAALLALAWLLPAYGQMYRWPDKDGRIHYSETPPPGVEKTERLGQPAATRAPARPSEVRLERADLPGGRFHPEEQAAAGVVCDIALMENRDCAAPLNRYCPLEELVKGVAGNRAVALKLDPRIDPNYQYRVDIRGTTIAISADARKPGLAGFFSEGEEIRYNMRGSAGKTDKVVKGGANCQGYVK